MKSYSVTIQMKATDLYLSMLFFFMLYKVLITFVSVNVTIQMKATEQYFPVVLFTMLYKVVLTR